MSQYTALSSYDPLKPQAIEKGCCLYAPSYLCYLMLDAPLLDKVDRIFVDRYFVRSSVLYPYVVWRLSIERWRMGSDVESQFLRRALHEILYRPPKITINSWLRAIRKRPFSAISRGEAHGLFKKIKTIDELKITVSSARGRAGRPTINGFEKTKTDSQQSTSYLQRELPYKES